MEEKELGGALAIVVSAIEEWLKLNIPSIARFAFSWDLGFFKRVLIDFFTRVFLLALLEYFPSHLLSSLFPLSPSLLRLMTIPSPPLVSRAYIVPVYDLVHSAHCSGSRAIVTLFLRLSGFPHTPPPSSAPHTLIACFLLSFAVHMYYTHTHPHIPSYTSLYEFKQLIHSLEIFFCLSSHRTLNN